MIDEILAVGDESFQLKCMEKFAEIRRSGRTIVLVSHGLDAVRNICDRAVWLDHGSMLKEGESHEVVTSYLESVRDDRRAHESADSVATPEETAEGSVGWHLGRVRVVDDDGHDVGVLRSGAAVTIRVEMESGADEDIALAIGLYRTDGVHVAGPVHRFRTKGAGPRVVEYRIPHLSLTGGVYDISTRLLDDHLQTTYAVRRRATRIDVESDRQVDIGGVVALGGSWTVS
jgi:hypothetical protein